MGTKPKVVGRIKQQQTVQTMQVDQVEPFSPLFLLLEGSYLLRVAVPENVTPPGRPTFYGLQFNLVEAYKNRDPGDKFFVVQTKRNLYLLDMRFVRVYRDILKALFDSNNLFIYNCIRTAFFYGMDDIPVQSLQTFNRNSQYENDRYYTTFLCENREQIRQLLSLKKPIDGFLFPQYRNAHGSVAYPLFHSEIILCEPDKNLFALTDQISAITQLGRVRPEYFLTRFSRQVRQIGANLQKNIKQMPFSNNIPVKSFHDVQRNAYLVNQKVMSRSSKFSIILKSTFYNPQHSIKFSLIEKITKYNYRLNSERGQPRHSKMFIDSFVLEFVNGQNINEYNTPFPVFIKTYTIAFMKDTPRNRALLKQIQQNQHYEFSSGSIAEVMTTTANPRDICETYKNCSFCVVVQECIEKNMTFGNYLENRTTPLRRKFNTTILISYILYSSLASLVSQHFTHNDLHLHNVLLDLDKQAEIVISRRKISVDHLPIIIDYGRCNTQKSHEFLTHVYANESSRRECQLSRTTRFKNSFNPSIDLLFLFLIKQIFYPLFYTMPSDDRLQACKESFINLLGQLPQDEYFAEVLQMPQRISYDEWIRGKNIERKNIRTVTDAFQGLRGIVTQFYDVLHRV